MKIRVLYFASLREQVGTGSEEIDLPAGIATVADLRAHLAGRAGPWATALAGQRLVRIAVNQDMVPGGMAIKPGDEVAFFPPVTGG